MNLSKHPTIPFTQNPEANRRFGCKEFCLVLKEYCETRQNPDIPSAGTLHTKTFNIWLTL
jgi:hypothetical protein